MISKQKLEKSLREKFYYGYDNREEILESIIYFANHELHQEKAKYEDGIVKTIDWYLANPEWLK